jgi:hypothetical protein
MYRYQREAAKRNNPYYNAIDMSKITPKQPNDMKYVALMSSASHTYGNCLAFMQNWILNLFPKDTFKTIHVNSKIAHRQIRSTGFEYVKKSKPMIIFRPRIGDTNEDKFLKGTPIIERQNNLYSTWGATNLEPYLIDRERGLEVKYQLNRSVMYIDVILVFSTLMNEIDYVHYIQNAVPLNKPFFIDTCFESYIPKEMLQIISGISDIPLEDPVHHSSQEFIKYMDGHSVFPTTYKLQGSSGTMEFYRFYPVNIETTLTDLSWDEGERVGHVMNQYQISFSVRTEFYSTGFYYIFSRKLFNQYKHFPVTHPEDSVIIPIFTDVVLKDDLKLNDGWQLMSSASCRLDKENDSICIDPLLNDSVRKCIQFHRSHGAHYFEFLDIKVRKQGEVLHENIDYEIDYDTMTVQFHNKDTYYTYKFLVCINLEYINDLIKTIFKANK